MMYGMPGGILVVWTGVVRYFDFVGWADDSVVTRAFVIMYSGVNVHICGSNQILKNATLCSTRAGQLMNYEAMESTAPASATQLTRTRLLLLDIKFR